MQLPRVDGIEITTGLISQYNIGLVDKGTGYGHALLLATRQLCRFMIEAVREPQSVEQLLGLLFDDRFGAAGQPAGNRNVFEGAELRQQMMKLKYEANVTVAKCGQLFGAQLKNIGTIDQHLALIGAIERAQHMQ